MFDSYKFGMTQATPLDGAETESLTETVISTSSADNVETENACIMTTTNVVIEEEPQRSSVEKSPLQKQSHSSGCYGSTQDLL